MSNQLISIEVVVGGFILTYPVYSNDLNVPGLEAVSISKEVFVSPRKLNQKIKEVIDSIGLVKDGK